ncbi:hypothetical protein F3Y22_tig00003398pilonHSYRG00243 [Hibiscus syriacus]|uniref:Uncharacterized protein n=1 Tax=Hibiscus syriacus TaxID=106335 RepID=A0A6A3CLQ6_HIBSY|nr:hypothetical protein F3Y22_tig00003398pilonHSYRG00243 [Hibiscus syriacus]
MGHSSFQGADEDDDEEEYGETRWNLKFLMGLGCVTLRLLVELGLDEGIGEPMKIKSTHLDLKELAALEGPHDFSSYFILKMKNSLFQNAKEHLAAVADKLGPSLTDIDLSDKSPHTPADAADQADGTEYVPPTKRRRGGKENGTCIIVQQNATFK